MTGNGQRKSDKKLAMCGKFLLLPFVALLLQAQVHVPRMGAVRCADGSVRPVYGVPAAFVLGKPLFVSAVSASFSSGGGIVAAKGAVHLLDATGKELGEFRTADPGTLVGIDAGVSTAAAWMPRSSSILFWDDGAFRKILLPTVPAGRVTGIRRSGSSVILLVLENEGGVSENTVSLSSGYITAVAFLAGVNGPAFRQGTSVFFANGNGLERETAGGATESLPLPAPALRMESMGQDWVHLFSASSTRHWALHLTNGPPRLYELPGIARVQEGK